MGTQLRYSYDGQADETQISNCAATARAERGCVWGQRGTSRSSHERCDALRSVFDAAKPNSKEWLPFSGIALELSQNVATLLRIC